MSKNSNNREKQTISASDVGTLPVNQAPAKPVVISQEQIQAMLQSLQAIAGPAKAKIDEDPRVAAVKASAEYQAASASQKAWMTIRARHTPEELAEIHKQSAAKATASRKAKAEQAQATLDSLKGMIQSLTAPAGKAA